MPRYSLWRSEDNGRGRLLPSILIEGNRVSLFFVSVMPLRTPLYLALISLYNGLQGDATAPAFMLRVSKLRTTLPSQHLTH